MTVFFRLLSSPIPAKGDDLRRKIDALNESGGEGRRTEDEGRRRGDEGLATQGIFLTDPGDFAAIPGTPFAYWASDYIRQLFITQPRFEQDGRLARVGDHPGDQERYLRLSWEITFRHHSENRRWVPYQKGGIYSPYYANIHLLADWDHERETYFDFHGRIGRSSEHPSNYQFFFRPGRAEAIEAEACQMVGVPDLRAWLRDPRAFFNYHIKRYSKSRRKAPIYWLLQSARHNYGIWLYYPRLNPDSLFYAGREYADAKFNLESARLEDLQGGLVGLTGSARKVQERKIAAQTALLAELKSFLKALDTAALLEIKPDLNDGVLLNIAPLHELVPWKEAGRAWQELLRGKYEWSSIGRQLKDRRMTKDG